MAHIIDGDLSDWAQTDRLDYAGTGVAGIKLYGAYEDDTGNYVFAASSTNTPIGAGTTFWLNTDHDVTTGAQSFGGPADTGAEFYVDFDSTGVPHLYNSAGVYVADVTYAYGANNNTVEFSVPKTTLNQTTAGMDLKVDINNNKFLPNVYADYTYTIEDPATLPPVTSHPLKIGIVFSATTAAQYFGGGVAGETAYSQLFMAAQNQATAAGIPFDVLTEADLKDLSKISGYNALVFPSFADVNSADVDQIQQTLTDAVYKYHVSLITAGDFMTNSETGAPLAGDPYERMKILLDLNREGGTAPGAFSTVDVHANDLTNPMLAGYASNELVREYTSTPPNATYPNGINFATSWYGSADSTPLDVIATQTVTPNGGSSTVQNAVVSTVTGATNVHFANQGFLGDNNMLQHALDYVTQSASGHDVSLHISRDAAVVATRVDMDQANQLSDVKPDDGSPGIYDKLLPMLQQWKAAYNFVGSYYIDIGDGTDPDTGQPDSNSNTNWSVSKTYYQQLLAMGNEIGSHSITHPEDTNSLTPAQIQYQFQTSKAQIEAQLGITVHGAAVPGMPDFLPDSKLIEQYYDYISGGTTFVGAGYPGAIGHLTPDDSKIYIAPNMQSDFTLVDYDHYTAAQAEAIWEQEFADLQSHSDMPVAVWTWHDYGPTDWVLDQGVTPNYTEAMYQDFIAKAYAAGSEFITLDDLADRMASFDASSLTYNYDAATNAITVTVGSADAGRFAIDLNATDHIKSVTGWYAYDDNSVFTDDDAGSYTINLGSTPDNVTHITKVADRADLKSVTGDGTNLQFSVVGEGHMLIDLNTPAGMIPVITGAGVTVSSLVNNTLDLLMTGLGQHDVTIAFGNDHAPAVPSALTASVTEGAAATSYDLLAGASDPDAGDTIAVTGLMFAIDTGAASATVPAGLTFDPATHMLSIDPSNPAFNALALGATQKIVASYNVTDSHNLSTPQTETITITGTNDAPIVATALTAAVNEGATATSYDLLTGASDPDTGDTIAVSGLMFAIDAGAASATVPTGLTFDPATHLLTIDPTNAAFNHLALGATQKIVASYSVTDSHGLSTPQTETITITGTNDAPIVAAALTASAVKGGAVASYDLLTGATDPDTGDVLSVTNLMYSVDGGAASSTIPAGLTFDLASHTLTLDPSNAAFSSLVGTRTIVASYNVTDPNNATVAQTETLTISGSDNAPVVAAPLTAAVTEGAAATSYDLLTGASDPDAGDTLSVTALMFAVDGGTASATPPAGLTFNAATHTLTIDPNNAAFNQLAQGATQKIVASYSVTDSHNVSTSQTETVTITGTNDAPVVAAALTASVTEGNPSSSYDLLTGVTDPDTGDVLSVSSLTYKINGGAASTTAPAGLVFNAATHSVTINPSDASFAALNQGDVRTLLVNYNILDSHGGSIAQSETITVNGVGQPSSGTTFNCTLAQAHVTFVNGHDYVQAPNGVVTDVTNAPNITFTDGVVHEKDGLPLVDDLFYDVNNPDVWAAHMDPDLHYAQYGWKEGRNPDPFFSTNGYLAANPDVAAAHINPLQHYDQFGWKEGRDAGPNFDTSAYLIANPDVAAAHIDPLAHYLQYGALEGRTAYTTSQTFNFKLTDANVSVTNGHEFLIAPNGAKTDVTGMADLVFKDGIVHEKDGQPLVDDLFYYANNHDVWAAHIDPDVHYAQYGWKEGRNPDAFFSTSGYLAANPDVAAAHINPLQHYDQFGWKEGRDPGPNFDTSSYLAANPDVAAAHIDPLAHYLQFGMAEGRHIA